MSRMVDDEFSAEFEMGERVSFDYYGTRLVGRIVRVYNTRTLYHVEVDGQRYETRPYEDDMRRL